jgi:hypothetical protein
MNQFALRMFVRSIIAEAKDKKAEPKKSVKTEEKAPKSSGKLVDLKKELAALEQYKDELMAAKFAEKTTSTEVEFADLAKFAKELDALKEKGIKLEQDIDARIEELKTKISDAKNKIKEMMGLAPEKGQEKMMDEKKMTSVQKNKKEDIVKGMKKSDSFGKSKDEKSKMYATATKLATKKVMKEYETYYERIGGSCYRINDEGERQKVADHYCK